MSRTSNGISHPLTVDDLQGVQVFKRENDFANIEQGRFKIQCDASSHVGKQLSAGNVLQKHVEKLIGVVRPIHSDDERVRDSR